MDAISNRFANLSPLKQAVLALEEVQARLAESEIARFEPIAIVGMGCRFPRADNPSRFWRLIRSGDDAVSEVPACRWKVDDYYDADPDAAGKISTRWGGFLDHVDQFDAEFFGISPREANSLDPQQRLLLEIAWEALENAGQNPHGLAGRQTGIFVGITSDEYAHLFIRRNDPSMFNGYFASGIARSVAGGRIAYTLGAHGPNLSIDTACSSSLVAIHTACLHLRMRECRMALAGGCNILLGPEITIALSRAHMMAADGRCKTFDAKADGFVRGEGCGMVVLKRLSDAVADGDNILALIRGSAVNQDGRSGGLTVPNGLAQEALIRQALANARVQPEEIGYVEAHGTGTSLGDPIEAHALAKVLSAGRTKDNPLVVGSVKTNLGHLESAAGVAGLIKVVLSLQNEYIPRHLHFEEMNPHIDWRGMPVEIPVRGRPWPRGEKRRLAGVSSFGFSGTNAHVIVEEAPAKEKRSREWERPLHVLTLSACTERALEELRERYALELPQSQVETGDLCYTANAGRAHFDERAAYLVYREATGEQLRDVLGGKPIARGTIKGTPEVAFLFPGQGAQYAGMGKELYETQPVFRRTMDDCAALLRESRKEPLQEVLWGSATQLLEQTAYTQPALFAVEYALAELWKSWGIEPAVVLGHSVGEYVAACVAGVYSLEEGLKLIATRGELMQRMGGKGAMASVLAPEERVREALAGLEERVSIAALNAAGSVVISGYRREVSEVEERLRGAGVRVQRLAVMHAFHSPQMIEMEEEFEGVASGLSCQAPKIEIISSVTGRSVVGGEMGEAGYWRRQVREPVRFGEAMERLNERGCRVFVEAGAGTTLAGLGRQTIASEEALWAISLKQGRGEWTQMLESLGKLYVRGARIDWAGFDEPYRRKRVPLPTYPFQRQRYWLESKSAKGTQPRVATPGEHPLLGRKFEVAGDLATQVWENQISTGNLSYLADHRVFGNIIFPLTGYLEMMVSAVFSSDAGVVELRDVAIQEPLTLPAGEAKNIQTVLGGDGIEIYSGQGGKWKRHATARVAKANPATRNESVEILLARMPRRVQMENFYASVRERGMDFGSAFRTIRSLHRGAAEALARVAAANTSSSELADYGIHPALLDGCFQSLAGTLPEGDRNLYLPVRIQRFAYYRSPGRDLWTHSRLRPPTQSTQGSPTVDLSVFDETGIVAVAQGMELRPASAGALGKYLNHAAHSLFELQWIATELKSQKPKVSGDWLILADSGGTGARLAEHLTEKGARCTVLSQPARLRAAIQGKTLEGVIYLWALETPATSALTSELLRDSQRSICRSMLGLLHSLAENEGAKPPRLWLVTRGAQGVPGTENIALAQAAIWGLSQAITEERPELRCTCVDLDPAATGNEISALFAEIGSKDHEEQIAFRGSQRLVARLAVKPRQEGLDVPLRLVETTGGVLTRLRVEPAKRKTVPGGCVEIEVAASGLNFRDVLNALGMYQSDPGPLGSECAGRIVAVGAGVDKFCEGDEVIAMTAGAHDGFVIADARLVARKPSNLRAEAAATLPTAFLTARYTLEYLANIRQGKRVLIHAATGGVGMAALQIAQRAGAEIFATAGSERKREFLRSLGIRHVMDSRSLDFARTVMEETAGRGVDIVLNSLNSEFIAAGFSVLATNGQFLEIGKRDIWTSAQADSLCRGIAYHVVDLGQVAAENPDVLGALLRDTVGAVERGELICLPAEVFSLRDASTAFQRMAQAQHIGKVVLRQDSSAAWISGNATYLIAGGFGALGQQVAKWLIDRGAGCVVLAGRSGPGPEFDTPMQFREAKRGRVVARRVDVSRRSEVEALLSEMAETMPPLRGVIHAAAVLDDGVLSGQTWERFERVLSPKVEGAWNLHTLTASTPLDFFILFSSAASILGAPGQGNYAAANSFEDALAHHRRQSGIPALSINWGAWKEGLASGHGLESRHRALGMSAMSSHEALEILEYVLLAAPAQVGAGIFDWDKFVRRFAEGAIPRRFSQLLTQPAVADDRNGGEPWRLNRLRTAPEASRAAILRDFVHTVAIRVLGFSADRRIDPEKPFVEMGLDSLMAVEFRNSLAAALDLNLPSTVLFSCPSIQSLSAFLNRLIFGEPSTSHPAVGSGQGARNVLDDIEQLSDEEVDRMLAEKMEASH